ncbi:hypothetical protein F443_11329 [Phytophthora nicotianae P1569]|uniref:Uncharacterized protein n=1 Tax=Phytophthora nicotianae P1569 TaxID=1317065 RepID=V9EXA4_PHYNI|nr:hypothetical protein F443_11329 [Phytophthora nicotianae P1569]
MDEYIVEVRLYKGSRRPEQLHHETIESLDRPCGMTCHSQSIPLGVLTAVGGMSLSCVRIWQYPSTKSSALYNTQPAMLFSNSSFGGCRCRHRHAAQLVESVNQTPLPVRFTNAESRRRVRGLRLPHHARLRFGSEEGIDHLAFLARELLHLSPGSWHQERTQSPTGFRLGSVPGSTDMS